MVEAADRKWIEMRTAAESENGNESTGKCLPRKRSKLRAYILFLFSDRFRFQFHLCSLSKCVRLGKLLSKRMQGIQMSVQLTAI